MAYLGWPLASTPDGGTANEFGNRKAYYPIGAMPSNGTLIGIDIYVGFNDASGHQMRVALYKGGTTPGSDLNGATLVEDLGAHTLVGDGWIRVASVTAPALVSGDQLIVAVKSGGGSGNYWIPYDVVDPGYDVLGFVTYTSDEANSDSDAWDATIAGASSSSTRWGAARIEYTAGGGSSTTATPATGSVVVQGRAPIINNFTNVRYQEVLINGAGSPMSNLTGLRFSVWYSGQCAGAPDLSYSDMTTGADGTASYSLASGSLVLGQKVFGVITDGGASLSAYTCGLLTLTYS